MEWIISLAAVFVSFATMVISYLTNRENLKNARENMLSERAIEFKVGVWNETIALCNQLVLVTNTNHLEKSVNIAISGLETDGNAEEVLNHINESCEEIYSLTFTLSVKTQTLNENCEEFSKKITSYRDEAIALYETIEQFYKRNLSYAEMVSAMKDFQKRADAFSKELQDYVFMLKDKIFVSDKGEKDHGNYRL